MEEHDDKIPSDKVFDYSTPQSSNAINVINFLTLMPALSAFPPK